VIAPPKIAAERLFRILLRAPRASLPIELPLAGAPPGAFRVVALSQIDEAEAFDEAALLPSEARSAFLGVEFAALALHQDGELVFKSGADLARLLREDEADRLAAAVVAQLAICSPSMKRIDVGAWMKKLVAGARKMPRQAITLARSIDGDIIDGGPRPDRYFGVAPAELTDGQWLAYHAARRAFVD
jgi:hypothetical protein